MTVVVAGFDIDPPFSHLRFAGLLDDEPPAASLPTKEDIAADERQLYQAALETPTRAYVLADSLLSRDAKGSRQPVAEHAEKIASLEIILSIPDFTPHGEPNGRFTTMRTASCGVAYAGSPHMWQLTLERFRVAMSNLHYTWVGSDRGVPSGYAICTAEDPDDLAFADGAFDESIDFNFSKLPPLEGSFIASVFATCFDAALMDHFPKEFENSKHPVNFNIQIDFLLLVFCEKEKKPKIYRFGWELDKGQFPTGYKSIHVELGPHELAVLGHTSWKSALSKVRQQAVAACTSVQPPVEQSLSALVAANASANYVGGRLRAGVLSDRGFEKRK